jgi:nucleoside-diphosphate-sugar epimerase
MKVVVTGGTGLVGTYLQKYLDGVYLNSSQYDLTKEKDVAQMFMDHQPDTVIHLAAKVGGIMDNIEYPFEYYEQNLLMNTYVVKYARTFKVKKFSIK